MIISRVGIQIRISINLIEKAILYVLCLPFFPIARESSRVFLFLSFFSLKVVGAVTTLLWIPSIVVFSDVDGNGVDAVVRVVVTDLILPPENSPLLIIVIITAQKTIKKYFEYIIQQRNATPKVGLMDSVDLKNDEYNMTNTIHPHTQSQHLISSNVY